MSGDRGPAPWALLRPAARLALRAELNAAVAELRFQGPFVLLCNHASLYDPVIAAVCSGEPLRFQGSDRAPRRGFLLRLARSLQLAPELSLEEALRQAAAEGRSVGIFPEGTRCADGATGPIPKNLARLIRESGLGLVTFRITGAYLSAPRWADSLPRKGRIDARPMHRFRPESLAEIPDEELQALIEADLAVDACREAHRRPVPFRGERTAEGLERLLYICPRCGETHRIAAENDRVFCRACGFSTRYTLSGGLTGGGTPFGDVREWSLWQDERLPGLIEAAGEGPIFEDGGLELFSLRGGEDERVGSGGLHLYRDRLELPTGVAVPLEELVSLRLSGTDGLRLETRRGSRFEVSRIKPFCALKYLRAIETLKSPSPEEQGEAHEDRL
ncbi:MAG: 1-acyl-sn-glycerol-3-phosphate acyltransferase [Oscillospiraceae bacterium]|nr:1-acyl-sn-glycerol-3-phosphate acyltransferase [Oscillospiraceae bacterium]